MAPPVCVKFPLTFKTPLPEAVELLRSKVPPVILTFPFTVTFGEPDPFAKTNLLVAPETDKSPAMVIAGEVVLLTLTSLLCVF